jgi:hypothetical protein
MGQSLLYPGQGLSQPTGNSELAEGLPCPQIATSLTLPEAERLLDWLEAHDITDRTAEIDDQGTWTVCWQV